MLANADRGVVITRRIRGDFSADAVAWPERPKVFFLHAPATRDLESALIEEHKLRFVLRLHPGRVARTRSRNVCLRLLKRAARWRISRARRAQAEEPAAARTRKAFKMFSLRGRFSAVIRLREGARAPNDRPLFSSVHARSLRSSDCRTFISDLGRRLRASRGH